ncbi:hypothetical protein LEP1GSC040_3564 [Leptospira santarosai str. 2000030832]|nr:hypothetical protein LEP1GSC040_3564 [Leptospira santarosai str. 2000030832]
MGTLTKIFCEKTVRNRKRNIGFVPKNLKEIAPIIRSFC